MLDNFGLTFCVLSLTSTIDDTGGYDSELSDSEADSDAEGRRSDGDSSADEQEVDRRREDFRRKQRDRLKQVEREEKQAMGKCSAKGSADD